MVCPAGEGLRRFDIKNKVLLCNRTGSCKVGLLSRFRLQIGPKLVRQGRRGHRLGVGPRLGPRLGQVELQQGPGCGMWHKGQETC